MNDLNISDENIKLEYLDRPDQRLKILIPVSIIIVSALVVTFFVSIKPAAKPKRNNLTPPLTVLVQTIETQSFQVSIESYGTVSPRTQSFVVSQVSGQITEVSDKLREGSFFEKGDLLLKIDDRDYVADLKISEANVADAEQVYAEELAMSEQALDDWKSLGNVLQKPSDLVLRKPQQNAAKARLSSARASLAKSQLALERTGIVAPYRGRVLEKLVDLGQVASANTQVAEIYATDYFEIRLPIRTADLKFIDLPEISRGASETSAVTNVYVFSSLTEKPIAWNGRLVRTESRIDSNARQLHVVAQIDDPFDRSIFERLPLKIGEYVTVSVEGKRLEDAIVIPADSIYQNSYVYVVSDDVLMRREIEVEWQNEQLSLIGSGLEPGDRLVLTALGQVASGTKVKIKNQQATSPNPVESQDEPVNEDQTKVEPVERDS